MDNSNKRILARGCDPIASQNAARAIPPMIGNPQYIATVSDDEFIDKLKSQKWSVVFFAPGACRFNRAGQTIPGGNSDTQNWTLDQYKELVYQTQGNNIQIVETLSEQETVAQLATALEKVV